MIAFLDMQNMNCGYVAITNVVVKYIAIFNIAKFIQ